MKKLEVSEEFVKQVYEAACSTWKGKIEKEFPELFEVNLEVGRWYKNLTWEGSYMLHNGTNKDGYFTCCGVTSKGCWLDKGNWDRMEGYRLATPQEIESMLWKEAEKRGFREGVRFKSPCGGSEYEFTGFGNFYDNNFYDKSGLGLLFYQGKWAEIINPNKELQEEIEKIQKQLDELKLRLK